MGSFHLVQQALEAVHVRVHEYLVLHRLLGVRDRGKLLVVDVDKFERPLRDLLVVRHNRRDLLADEPHLALRQYGHVDDAPSPAHVVGDVVAREDRMGRRAAPAPRRRRCRVCARAGRGCVGVFAQSVPGISKSAP